MGEKDDKKDKSENKEEDSPIESDPKLEKIIKAMGKRKKGRLRCQITKIVNQTNRKTNLKHRNRPKFKLTLL